MPFPFDLITAMRVQSAFIPVSSVLLNFHIMTSMIIDAENRNDVI